MTAEPLMQARLDKLRRLREEGIDPYPPRFSSSHSIGKVIADFSSLVTEEHSGEQVMIAGRLIALRQMGRAAFLDLRDGSGRIQAHASLDGLGETRYRALCESDIGDFLGFSGEVFRTKRGELTVEIAEWTLLSKSLRPLPEKWHGLKDVELRYRHRSLDLIANETVRDTFARRSRMVSGMRRYLDEHGFLEVETPMMQPLAGGATARPFVTHHNALDVDLYLRIAPELYLKRLMIGGMERVYELAKNFRNEGVSTSHNPEFTTLEIYQAYTDYEGMMSLAEELIGTGAREAASSLQVPYQGETIDFSPPWRRIGLVQAVEEATGIEITGCSLPEINLQAKEKEIALPPLARGKLIEHLFEEFVEATLIQPTIVKDYPIEISPLAKRKPDAEGIVERFELFAGGMEIANAFTELNDPLDQRARFEAQEKLRVAGDDEAQQVDEDFLFALEHGMPPTGGIGIGIDRLAMLLTDSRSIRDVILFPALRDRKGP
jgi:lysyl-tRNA synthetase class 2